MNKTVFMSFSLIIISLLIKTSFEKGFKKGLKIEDFKIHCNKSTSGCISRYNIKHYNRSIRVINYNLTYHSKFYDNASISFEFYRWNANRFINFSPMNFRYSLKFVLTHDIFGVLYLLRERTIPPVKWPILVNTLYVATDQVLSGDNFPPNIPINRYKTLINVFPKSNDIHPIAMSTNDELPPPPPKPRASPLDFRNTDLVSRLLAATPPYLYNMPMVPNSYFFSEMLRSFVQAKSESNRPPAAPLLHRRPRKRSWTQSRSDFYPKEPPKQEKIDDTHNFWNKIPEKTMYYDNKPLELTQPDKPPLNNNNNVLKGNEIEITNKNEVMLNHDKHIPPMMFPNLPQNPTPDSQNLILPPPPPMWYPPLYPTPYGIDPLHFFIDLRVSGHIYDRKNGKDLPHPPPLLPEQPIIKIPEKPEPYEALREGFKQTRHTSAFSVPGNNINNIKNSPINLSNHKVEENKPLKFDVKSMGFDTATNKGSTSYVMKNITKIYKDLKEQCVDVCKREEDEIKCETQIEGDNRNIERLSPVREETEEEKEKRVKDLRALIGLELVVDYMNHAKPGQVLQTSDESTTDNESAASPTLEVVALHDDNVHNV